MARDIDVNISLGASLASSFTGSLTAAQSQVRGLATSLRQAEKQPVMKLSSGLDAQRQKLHIIGSNLKSTKAQLKDYWAQAEKAGTLSGFMARKITQAENRLSSLKDQAHLAGKAYRGLVSDAKGFSGSVRNLSSEYQNLTKNITRAKTAQARLSGNLAARQGEKDKRADLRGQVVETLAMGAAVAIPAKLAISAEDTFADLKKVLPNMDDTGLQQIFDDALAMSANTGKSLEDVLAIMTAGAQAGLGKTREEMVAVTQQALQMSVAWGVPAEVAGKSLATWQASMKLTAADSKKLADTINVLSDSMNAEAGEINEITTRMGPMLKGMGFGTAGIAAYSAAVKAAGSDVEVAGTALKNMNAVMIAGQGGLTKDQKGIYARLKIDPDTLAKQMTEDAEGATLMVLEALNTLPAHEKMSLSMRLFGKESIAAISPLLGNLDLLKESLLLAQGSVDDSVLKEYQNRMSTAAAAGARLSQNVRGLGIEVGKVLLPAVKEGFTQMDSFTSSVRGLAKDCPGLTKAVVYGTSALVGLAVAGLVGSYAFSGLRSAWLAAKWPLEQLAATQAQATLGQRAHTLASLSWRDVASGGASRVRGLISALARFTGIQRGATLATVLYTTASNVCGLAMLVLRGGIKAVGTAFRFAFGPVGLLIGALGLAAGLIIDNWDTVGPYFKTLWDGVVGVFQDAWNLISGIIDKVSNGMSWIGEQIDSVPVLGSAKRGFGKAWDWAMGNDEADSEAPTPSLAVEAAQKKLDSKKSSESTQAAPAAQAVPAVQGDAFGYTPFPADTREGFWSGVGGLFGFGGNDEAPNPAPQAPTPSLAVEASQNMNTNAFAAQQAIVGAIPAFSQRPPIGMATNPDAAIVPRYAEREAARNGAGSKAGAANAGDGAAGNSGQTFNMPMSFQVQGLDMPTFKARIQDCREDFAAIVRREVSAMQHQQQRTAYAR